MERGHYRCGRENKSGYREIHKEPVAVFNKFQCLTESLYFRSLHIENGALQSVFHLHLQKAGWYHPVRRRKRLPFSSHLPSTGQLLTLRGKNSSCVGNRLVRVKREATKVNNDHGTVPLIQAFCASCQIIASQLQTDSSSPCLWCWRQILQTFLLCQEKGL